MRSPSCCEARTLEVCNHHTLDSRDATITMGARSDLGCQAMMTATRTSVRTCDLAYLRFKRRPRGDGPPSRRTPCVTWGRTVPVPVGGAAPRRKLRHRRKHGWLCQGNRQIAVFRTGDDGPLDATNRRNAMAAVIPIREDQAPTLPGHAAPKGVKKRRRAPSSWWAWWLLRGASPPTSTCRGLENRKPRCAGRGPRVQRGCARRPPGQARARRR